MGIWGGFLQGPTQPTRQLMLPRLMNLLVNPFAKLTHDGLASFQKSIYQWSKGSTLGQFADGFPPQWPMIEFIPLGPLKTGRSRIQLPDDFVLLSYFASSSSNVKGGFRVSVYDVNRRRSLTVRPVNFGTIGGGGSAPLFLQRPYPFGRSINNSPPSAKITVVSLESVNSNIQFGFYGVIAPGYTQP